MVDYARSLPNILIKNLTKLQILQLTDAKYIEISSKICNFLFHQPLTSTFFWFFFSSQKLSLTTTDVYRSQLLELMFYSKLF